MTPSDDVHQHDWWQGLPPVQVDIECAGATHRLRWEAGELLTLDHHDVGRDTAFAALAGSRSACIDYAAEWRRRRGDLTILALGSRGPTDPLVPHDDEGQQAGTFRRSTARPSVHVSRRTSMQFVGYAPLRGAARSSASSRTETDWDELVLDLLRLDSGLSARLQAEAISTQRAQMLAGQQPDSVDRARCWAALYGRALEALRTWLRRPGLKVELTMLEEGADPSAAWDDETIRLSLPFGWLLDVWVPGLAIFWDRFCLGHPRGKPSKLAVVDRSLGPLTEITLEVPW